VETNNLAQRAGRWRARRFHIGILRPSCSLYVNFW
jgi:hypothetical protein